MEKPNKLNKLIFWAINFDAQKAKLGFFTDPLLGYLCSGPSVAKMTGKGWGVLFRLVWYYQTIYLERIPDALSFTNLSP